MISCFFPRRLLCFLMAILTLFCALSPAFFQPAEAVAVADDVLIASLGLLAMSWAGISFSSCAGAQTAVNSFLDSKPAAKLSLAALMTKNLVVDGSKLLLTSDVRDVFKSVLPDIQDFFQVKSDTVTSAGSGALSGSYVIGASYSVPVSSGDSLSDYLICPMTSIYRIDAVGTDDRPWSDTAKIIDSTSYPGDKIFQFLGMSFLLSYNLSFGLRLSPSHGLSIRTYSSSGSTGSVGSSYAAKSATITIVSSDNTVDFKQSKEVDGTQVTEISWGITFVPDPSDPTQPTDDGSGNKNIPVWPLGPQTDVIQAGTDQAEQDPGLSPEEMLAQLKQLLESQQSGGGSGTTDPGTSTDPSAPDTPGGSTGTAPDFNGMMLPGLKDFFPFCIPFDLKKMMDALCADPVAPKFTFATSFLGQVYTVDIDLSAWNGVATTVRYMVVAIYIVGLAVATRKFIKW